MEVNMEKYGFIYLWYDRKRKMFYLGSHWGTIDDGYICSSNRMRDAYRRRPNDFKRRIVKINVSRETLLDEEHKWLGKISDDELGKRYYNLRKHKWGHWSTDYERNKSVSDKLKGQKRSDEIKKKISESTKKGMANTQKKIGRNKGCISNRKGLIFGSLSDEVRRKISEKNRGKSKPKRTEEHKQ